MAYGQVKLGTDSKLFSNLASHNDGEEGGVYEDPDKMVRSVRRNITQTKSSADHEYETTTETNRAIAPEYASAEEFVSQ